MAAYGYWPVLIGQSIQEMFIVRRMTVPKHLKKKDYNFPFKEISKGMRLAALQVNK